MAKATEQFNYPITLNLRGRLAVVVGAGQVGQRKLQRLLKAGARVRLVDPLLADNAVIAVGVENIPRCFEDADLYGAQFVFACADSLEANQRVTEAARRQNLLCCCSDQVGDGDFALPAVLQRGNLTVAVSTGGGSPGLAVEIRNRLADHVPEQWGLSLELIAEIRRKLLTVKVGEKYNQQVLRHFLIVQLLPLAEQGKLSEIDQLLQETFGSECSLERLQVQLPEGIA